MGSDLRLRLVKQIKTLNIMQLIWWEDKEGVSKKIILGHQ